jgi:hypothetical protein
MFVDPFGLAACYDTEGHSSNNADGSNGVTWDYITVCIFDDGGGQQSMRIDPVNYSPYSPPARNLPNGRNCSIAPASAAQYAAATAEVVTLTAQFATGLGSGDRTFGPDTATSQVMGQSSGVQEALGQYLLNGQTSGLYTFGASGAYVAGGNPVAQFVGSFTWSISGDILSLKNTTSFRSLTYDKGPQWQRSSMPSTMGGPLPTPMGNTHQTYQIRVKCQ